MIIIFLFFLSCLNASEWTVKDNGFHLHITKDEANFTLNASLVHPLLRDKDALNIVSITWMGMKVSPIKEFIHIPNPNSLINIIPTDSIYPGELEFVLHVIHQKDVYTFNFNVTLKDSKGDTYWAYDKNENKAKLNDKVKDVIFMMTKYRFMKAYLASFAFINTFYQVFADFIRTFLVCTQYRMDMNNGFIEDWIHRKTHNDFLRRDFNQEAIHLWRSLSINTTHYDSFKTRLDLRKANYTIQDYLNWNRIEHNPSFVTTTDIIWDGLSSFIMFIIDIFY